MYLAHHGIKGQKWGVRRYQNPDGTLTAEGRQRYKYRSNIIRNRPYTDDVNDIVRTLSKKERDFLGAEDNKDWIEKKHELETLTNKHGHNWKDDWSNEYAIMYRPVKKKH